MKQLLLLGLLLCRGLAEAQMLKLVSDSMVAQRGNRTDTVVMKYVYNNMAELTRINHFVGANSRPAGYEMVFTGPGGRIDSLVRYSPQNMRTGEFLKNTYAGTDLVQQDRVRLMGGPGGKWVTTTNKFRYNAGVVTSWQELTNDTMGGGGEVDSLSGITITGGNPVNGTLFPKQGSPFSVSVVYDSTPNIFAGWGVHDEFPDYHAANNIRMVTGNSQTQMHKQYTYANGRVASVFQSEDSGRSVTNYYHYALTTGLGDVERLHPFTIYPNPSAGGLFTIETKAGNSPTQLWVSDLAGKTMSQTTLSAAETRSQLNLSHLKPGIYLVRMGSVCRRIIIQ